ncbi:putative pentatricopeptide repeat-containing protein At1g12700, mitochondrial [Silene latifolia]|uniref:putative pentatricopeptide repeat-containing protein At1g12700, mitochondrial n=1 Tax=Silene latifolia TaxID=37657 RepID=UPI003D77DA0F
MSSPFSKLGFRFQLNFQFNSRHLSNSAHFKATTIDDSRKFMDYVREQCQLGFTNLQFPINLFHQMMALPRRPSIIDFNRLLAAMLKLKRLQPQSTVISLYSHLDLSGTRPDSHSMAILSNCYCHLGRVDFGYALLAKSQKLGYPFESNFDFFNTLVNGFVHNNQLPQAVELFDVAVVKLGIQPDIVTYGTMVKGLCGIRDYAGALHLLHQMNSRPSRYKSHLIMYNTVIHSLCRDKLLTQARTSFQP